MFHELASEFTSSPQSWHTRSPQNEFSYGSDDLGPIYIIIIFYFKTF